MSKQGADGDVLTELTDFVLRWKQKEGFWLVETEQGVLFVDNNVGLRWKKEISEV